VPGHRSPDHRNRFRGIVVRSPGIKQGFLGGLKQIFGGNIEAFAQSAIRLARCLSAHVAHAEDKEAERSSDALRRDGVRPSVRRKCWLRDGGETERG